MGKLTDFAGCVVTKEQRIFTAARWPNFRPNNSKEAPKKCPWPEKIGGRKIAEFRQKWQKRGRKIFLQLFREETL
jgi:hypothetical protein